MLKLGISPQTLDKFPADSTFASDVTIYGSDEVAVVEILVQRVVAVNAVVE